MSLSCSCGDFDPFEVSWYWYGPDNYTTFNRKRRVRCSSCNELINIGSACTKFPRYRVTHNDIEERIHGEEIQLAPYFMCEKCSDLWFSLDELGFCCGPDESMADMVEEYVDLYGPATATKQE